MKIFITDVLTIGDIDNAADIVNLVARVEMLKLNYEEAGLIKLEANIDGNNKRLEEICRANDINYSSNSRCRDSQEYQIDLEFDMEKLVSFLQVDIQENDEDAYTEELNEAFRESDLYSDILSDVEDIIEKYNKDLSYLIP